MLQDVFGEGVPVPAPAPAAHAPTCALAALSGQEGVVDAHLTAVAGGTDARTAFAANVNQLIDLQWQPGHSFLLTAAAAKRALAAIKLRVDGKFRQRACRANGGASNTKK